jgi:hypothetical protein
MKEYIEHKPGEWGGTFRLEDFKRDLKEYAADVRWRRIFGRRRK